MEQCPQDENSAVSDGLVEDEAAQASVTELPPVLNAIQLQRAVLDAEWFWYGGAAPECWDHAPYAPYIPDGSHNA